MYGKCIENSFNWNIQNVDTMGFKCDVLSICKAGWALSVS